MTAHGPTLRTYFVIYIALMALLAATVAFAFVHLGPANIAIMLLIAFTKAVLIALYFMHVRYSSLLVQAAAGGTLIWLAILFGITMSDYTTRGMWSTPQMTNDQFSIDE
jgi:cytochrome c oxidase subunit 4